jgi:hypothetical protein
MKLNKGGFWVWPASLGAGFSLAYTTTCHWFGFLSVSKIHRLELLVVFGAIFVFLNWQLLKHGTGKFLENISLRRVYLFLAAAVVIAGVITLVGLPLSQNSLISGQTQTDGTLTPTTRLLWMGLKLADFTSLVSLVFIGEVLLSLLSGCWKSLLPVIQHGLAVFFPVGLLLGVGVVANVAISVTGQLGTLNKLTPLSANGLIALDEGSNTFMENIRVYTILFEHYQDWTLVTPADLLQKLEINAGGRLKRWGRIKSIMTVDYPAALSDQEKNDMLALKHVNVENGLGLHYIAVLEDDSTRKICFRTYQKIIFIVPVSLSPICESR